MKQTKRSTTHDTVSVIE